MIPGEYLLKSDPIELSQKLPDLIEKWRDTFGV